MTPRIGVRDRRARLGLRHRLAPGSQPAAQPGGPAEVAASLVAVHGTDPSSAYLGILARLACGDVADVERALYQDRTLIRLLGMRRTVFLATLPTTRRVIQAACSRAVAARERRKLVSASWPNPASPARWAPGWRRWNRPRWRRSPSAARRPRPNWPTTTRGCAPRSCWPGARLRRPAEPGQPGAVPARRAGTGGAGPAARLVDLAPVPVVADGAVVPGRPGRLGRPGRPRLNWPGAGCRPTARPQRTTCAGGRAGRRPS